MIKFIIEVMCMKTNRYETIIVMCLIGTIIILLVPVLQNIIYKAQADSIKSNAESIGVHVQLLYAEANVTDDVALPFTVKFNKNGYTVYSENKEIKLKNKLNTKERVPTNGEVLIQKSGAVEIKNLQYSKYICTQLSNGEVKCQRNS